MMYQNKQIQQFVSYINIFTFILKLLFNIQTPYVSIDNFINTLCY